MQIIVPDDKRAVIVRTLSALLGPTRAAPGCLGARLYADLGNRRMLVLNEEWESHASLGKQLDAEKIKLLVAAIELSLEAPVITVDTVKREEGLSALETYRDGIF